MIRLLALPLVVALAACAPSAPLTLGANHPASPEAPVAEVAVEVDALAAVAEPRVPAALRPDGLPPAGSVAGRDPEPLPHGVDHDATTDNPSATMGANDARMAHTAMNHGRTTLEAPTPPEPLGDVPPAPTVVPEWDAALDAYLAVHDALASDRLDAEAARQFAAAFDALVEAPPASDPHVWHVRGDDVAAVREAADVLADAGDLDAARTAFGHLSAPLVRLAEAAGADRARGLDPYTCGMAPGVPEGGVWLQREGSTRNPYFGAAMPMCGSEAHGHGAEHEHAGHGR
jgi:hypothetical protein